MIGSDALEREMVRISTLLTDARGGFTDASEKSTRILAHQLDALRWVAEFDPVPPSEHFTEKPAGRNVQPWS